jgi:hypothetical protein
MPCPAEESTSAHEPYRLSALGRELRTIEPLELYKASKRNSCQDLGGMLADPL